MTDGPRKPPRPKLKFEELLLRHGVITAEQLQHAQEEQKKWGGDLGHVLVDLGFIGEDLLMKALAHQLGVPLVDPANQPIPKDVVNAIPVQICERYGVIPVGGDLKTGLVRMASHDPGNPELMKSLATLTGYRVEPAAALAASIERGIRRHYYGEGVDPAAAAAAAAPRAAPAPAFPLEPQPAPGEPLKISPLQMEIANLIARVDSLEEQMVSNPHFAGLMARLERLEQIAATEIQAIRVITDVLIEQGFITRDEYFRRVKQRP
jgi:type IV pilus assembly protein PilB